MRGSGEFGVTSVVRGNSEFGITRVVSWGQGSVVRISGEFRASGVCGEVVR